MAWVWERIIHFPLWDQHSHLIDWGRGRGGIRARERPGRSRYGARLRASGSCSARARRKSRHRQDHRLARGDRSSRGNGYRVLSCRAAPTEARLSFAALGDLLAPIESSAFDSLAGSATSSAGCGAPALAIEGRCAQPARHRHRHRLARRGLAARPRARRHRRSAMARSAVGARAGIRAAPARGATDRRARHRAARRARLRERVAHSLLDDRFRHLRVGPLSLAALVPHHRARSSGADFRVHSSSRSSVPAEAIRFMRSRLRARSKRREARREALRLPIPDNLRELVAKQAAEPAATDARRAAQSERAGAADDRAGRCRRSRAGGRGRRRSSAERRPHRIRASAVRRCGLRSGIARAPPEAARRSSRRSRTISKNARGISCSRARTTMADEHVASVLHDAAEHALRRGAVEIAADLDEQSARRTPARQDGRSLATLLALRQALSEGGRSGAIDDRSAKPCWMPRHRHRHACARPWSSGGGPRIRSTGCGYSAARGGARVRRRRHRPRGAARDLPWSGAARRLQGCAGGNTSRSRSRAGRAVREHGADRRSHRVEVTVRALCGKGRRPTVA